ncbi:deoxyhypusine hydroxylase isoform X3 [Cryptomeria japonica]|uniref:deoxyhypusine hydroxylase isoform X3 n=1 Tax=Cryptomeria japonica TaxID=3369 RepID=UPI0025AB7792|nr:deoxyhypusine hydroxylase isoform X3 [Cryptomeria japonica]
MEDEASPLPAFEASFSVQQLLADRLLDQAFPISERFRALFSLRNLKGSIPRQALIVATRDSSNLLAHEAAFALGQMQDAEAVPALKDLLLDYSIHPIVRHEAAEALGAIGLDDYVPLLQNSLKLDPAQEVQETCELALKRIEKSRHKNATKEIITEDKSPFLSVDPAVPASSETSIEELRKELLDEEKGMYERYAALFALRNHGGAEAVDAIVAALQAQSALLRHEITKALCYLKSMKKIPNLSCHKAVKWHLACSSLSNLANHLSSCSWSHHRCINIIADYH